jgi:hypothetical protein
MHPFLVVLLLPSIMQRCLNYFELQIPHTKFLSRKSNFHSCRSSCLCDVYSTCLLLQQWWEVMSMNAKSECIWYLRNLRACTLSLPVFCPFGSHLLNKTLQCTFLKCLKVSVWNAWYGVNSHRKSFTGVLELPHQIVVMPTPEIYQ